MGWAVKSQPSLPQQESGQKLVKTKIWYDPNSNMCLSEQTLRGACTSLVEFVATDLDLKSPALDLGSMQLDMKTLVGKLNRPCRKALESAAHLALNQTHYYVEVEHYLLKLFEMPDTDLLVVVRQYDVDLARIVKELSKAVDGYGKGNGRTPSLSPVINELLQGAWTFASLKLGASAIRSGAILQATLDHEEIVASLHKKAPTVANIYRERMRVDLPDLIGISREVMPTPVEASKEAARLARERAAAARQEIEGEAEPEIEEEKFERRDTPALDQFTVSLTEQAAVGLTDPIIGRDAEIRQIIDILMRRRQNNPILTGEAGVGKTAVVEGFAQRVAVGDVPPPLQDVDVRALDLGLLQAGAGVKGEFEERLKNVIAEVQGSAQPIVLFIDEAHTLIGAGGAAGSGDAANLLKPALARGDLRTIAATTWSEYKKYVEKDPALARRFQVVKVDEPNEDQAIDMLRGLALRLEEHHKVRILDEALQEASRLSARYISGRYLPDKAIGVLDTACARVAVAQNAQPAAMEAAIRRAERLTAEIEMLIREEATGWDHDERIDKLKTQLEAADSDRRRLQERWEQERGVVEEISDLLAAGEGGEANMALKDMQARLAALQGDDPMVPSCVDGNVIAQVVAGWTGIPVGRMMRDEINAVLNLETRMGERIVGQNHAVGMVAERIRTYHASLGEPGKPIGVFLFAGPSGVGKTETALTLSELLYGGERNLITINMSEYQEAHTVSNLKGAPPGYVGYGQGGVLTEAVRRNPYAVVLLDEVEKAHPDVMELFYQVFDKGRLEDAEGIEVDFKNTIIIMTSNLGTDIIASSVEAGEKDPAVLAEKVRPALLGTFKPALLGRLSVVPYLPLNDEEIRAIVALKLNKIQIRYEENHGAVMSVSKKVADAIVARCTEVESGARNIDQIINQRILPHLSEEILKRMAGEVPVGSVKLTLIKNGDFHFAFEKS